MERTYRGDVQYLVRILSAADATATSDLDVSLEIVLREATKIVEIYHFRIDDPCERATCGRIRED